MQKILFIVLSVVSIGALLIAFSAKPIRVKRILTESLVTYPWAKDKPPPWDGRLTVMTYNIGYASGDKNNKGAVLTETEHRQNLNTLIKTICDSGADVVALQEVDFYSARSLDVNQLSEIAQACDYGHALVNVTWNKQYVPWPYFPPTRHFGRIVSGQAILSRFPILSSEIITHDKPRSNPFWYNWYYLDRISQKILLDIGNREVEVWNVHLEAFDAPTRLSQAYQLAYHLKQHPHPKRIVMGDFNSVSLAKDLSQAEDKSESLAIFLENGLTNAETPDMLTIPSWEPDRKIDHVLFSNGLWLANTRLITGVTASDHLPVIATFGL